MSPGQNHNLYHLFERACPPDGASLLLQTPTGDSYSYADVERESARLANYLIALGARPGDRVTVQVEKSPRVLCLYLACLRAGLVYHPLNTAYQASELAYFLDNARPRSWSAVPTPWRCSSNWLPAPESRRLLTLEVDGAAVSPRRPPPVPRSFDTVVREADDLAALLYSSGTTGRPKGIMLTHGNLASNGRTLVEIWGFSADDVLLHALPVFHVHGLFVAINCVLLQRCASMLLAGQVRRRRSDGGACPTAPS